MSGPVDEARRVPADDAAAAGECPRCGHDLRGTVAAWSGSCPLAGRCTECGVAFAWGDVLSDRLRFPRWSVEGGRGPLDLTRRAGRQLLVAALRPRLMLRGLRLEHRIRPLRLLATASLLAVVIALAAWAVVTVEYVRFGAPVLPAMTAGLRPWDDRPPRLTVPVPAPGSGSVAVQARGTFFVVPSPRAGPRMSVPLDAVVPPEGLQAGGWARFAVETRFGGVLVVRGDRPGGRISPAEVARVRGIRTALLPLGAPANVLSRASRAAAGLLLLVGLPVGLVAVAGAGAFAILPIARRRARVRWAHLGRLALLAALGTASLAVLLGVVASVVGRGLDADGLLRLLGLDRLAARAGLPDGDAELMLVGLGWVAIPIAYAATWWTWAARHYLRMQRPVAVGLAVAAVADAAVVTAVVLAVFGLR